VTPTPVSVGNLVDGGGSIKLRVFIDWVAELMGRL